MNIENLNQVLITGGTGYIGSHFLKTLKNTEFIVFDRSIKKDRLKYNNFIYIEKDIGNIDSDDIPSKLYKFIHTSYCKNLQIEKKLLELVLKKNPDIEIIFFSSSAVYGDLHLAKKDFFDTEDPANPVNDYGRYKLELENYIKEHFKSYKILRISNPYGKEYETKGVYPLFKQRIEKSLETNYQASFVINYPQARVMMRDMIYIDKAIEQIISVYNSTQSGIYNIASGQGMFLEDLAYLALKDICIENNLDTSKFKLNFTYREKPDGEIVRSVLREFRLKTSFFSESLRT